MNRDIIRVDRTVKPVYPPQVVRVLHPELELVGPAEYDLADLKQWLHDGQRGGTLSGQAIYEHLTERDLLSTCLGVKDAEALQKQGGEAFRNLLSTVEAVYFWAAVAEDAQGFRYVLRAVYVSRPHPFEWDQNRLPAALVWSHLGDLWGPRDPALCFRI
jgi:hypothetical protein